MKGKARGPALSRAEGPERGPCIAISWFLVFLANIFRRVCRATPWGGFGQGKPRPYKTPRQGWLRLRRPAVPACPIQINHVGLLLGYRA